MTTPTQIRPQRSTTSRSRRTLRYGASVTSLVGALVFGAGTAQAATIESVTDEYLFNTSLTQFADIRAQRPHADKLDWSSDACSWSPDKPLGYNFTPACTRHDFGYRNYKKQVRFTAVNRKRIDDKLYADLLSICAGQSVCNGTAFTYYYTVRTFGGPS